MAEKCKITGSNKRRPNADGSCPECATPEVKLTGKGFVASHDIMISLGDGPQIPVTDEGPRVGDPRDAAIRREVEATHIRAGNLPVPMGGTPDPVMTTGHGRGPTLVRGRSMAPVQPQRGYAAAAGTMAGNLGRERFDREVIADPSRKPKRSKASKRRYRTRQTTMRWAAQRKS